jgi:hypothetical protein
MVPQLKRFGEVLAGPSCLIEAGVVQAHRQVTQGKVWIQFDGPLSVGQGSGGAFLVKLLLAKAVRFQRFEGRRRGLRQRYIKLLHRRQRFAQFAAQLGCRFAERVQHLLLGWRRYLLLDQGVSALAIHRLQSQHEFAAQTGNRSGNVGLASRAQTQLARHLGGEFRARRSGHLLQGLHNTTVGEHTQERRLPQGNVEACFQSFVENRIARGVGEISKDDGVLVRQSVGLAGAKQQPTARSQSDEQYRCTGGCHPWNGFAGRPHPGLSGCDAGPARV